MCIRDSNIDNYVVQHTSKENDLLYRLNRETYLKVLQPRMLSGHFQGRALSMFSKMIKPQRILEVGTYTGYSALCLAEGLVEGGRLHTIDKNEEREELVQCFVDESPYKGQVIQHIGNAIEIIPTLKENWDIVFIDADKENYINYYNLLINHLKSGAYIIADNVLWSGKVIQDYDSLDLETKTLVDYNKMIQEDSRVENVIFPIRDGLNIARVI